MVDFTQKAQYTVEDLRRIVALLRAPGGCPWDGAQTHESIRRNFIEEAYEVAEAIDEQRQRQAKQENFWRSVSSKLRLLHRNRKFHQ